MKLHKQAIKSENVKAALVKAAKRKNQERLKSAEKFGDTEMKPATFRDIAPNYKARAAIFSGKNWFFDPTSLYSTSYNWWPMLAIIKGKLVRNDMNYSQSTTGHQGKLDDCLIALNIKPDVTLSVRSSLNNLDSVRRELLQRWATDEVRAKYSRLYKKNRMTKQLIEAEKIGIKFSKKVKSAAVKEAEFTRRSELDRKNRNKVVSTKQEIIAAEPQLRIV